MKTVLITGGSRGIGKGSCNEICRKRKSNNNKLCFRQNRHRKIKKELLQAGAADVLLIKADVSNSEDVKNMVKEINRKV